MADRASSSIVIDAAPEAVMAVIADFPRYPEWTSQIKDASVDATDGEGRPTEVTFVVDAGVVKDTYTLAYDWSVPDQVSWHLLRGQMQKAQDGSYRLRGGPEGTEVVYELSVDLAIPMLGMFKRKAEKVIIDAALRGLKDQVERG